jgi:hypothetical protein
MARHQFEQRQAAEQSKNNRAEETFPRLLPANVRDHQMPSDGTASQIGSHVGKFCDRDQIQDIKLSGQLACARSWR